MNLMLLRYVTLSAVTLVYMLKVVRMSLMTLTSKITGFRYILPRFTVLEQISQFSTKMAKKALVFAAPGAEEMELVISIDVLRRGGVR